jgi:CRISPR-associated exonuclease Cas4
MEYKEESYLMISGIQHFEYCKRQWALIHIEQQWEENVHTVVGELMHKKVHDPYLKEKRKDLIVARALPVCSRIMGVSGECDLVEFQKCEEGISLHGYSGVYSVFPVEYKKGKPKITEEDVLQLTAQAMCLEEMLSTQIPQGAIFYGETRHRELVDFSEDLKRKVREMFLEMHLYFERKHTPKVRRSKKCNHCSLQDICMPELQNRMKVNDYMKEMLTEEKE